MSTSDDPKPSPTRGTVERLAPVVAGSALVLLSVRRRSAASPALALAGGTLAYVGLNGRVGMPDWLASRLPVNTERAMAAEQVVTILRAREDLFRAWRDFDHRSRFLRDGDRVEEQAEELIRWQSGPGERTGYRGSVRFDPAPGGRGTEVRVWVTVDPPAGLFPAAVAWLRADGIDRNVREALRAFKQYMEAAENPTNDGQPMGSCVGQGDRR